MSSHGELNACRSAPRSKTGCWTCRKRKVKCDEIHPKCAQCTRLGLRCDYSPRMNFRHGTAKVMKKMQDISLESTVWDATSPISSPSSSPSVDTLPPFSCLTNDIEREMKAERSTPGTYVVVLRPESFGYLPEYTEDRAGSFSDAESASTRSSVGGFSAASPSSLTPDDPNVVILPRFEDPLSPRCVCRKASPGMFVPLGNPGTTLDADYSQVARKFPRTSSSSFLDTPVSTKGLDMAAHQVLETRAHSAMVQLYHALQFFAADLGLRDRTWRMADRGHAGFPPTSRTEKLKQVFGTQDALIHTWISSGVSYIEKHGEPLSKVSRRLLQKCHAVFHCAILFSYAIIWSTQRVENGELPIPETEQHVSAILHIAIDVVGIDVVDFHFIVFPVLVAGITSSLLSQKMLALDLLLTMENAKAGGKETAGAAQKITSTKLVMQNVYQRQEEGLMRRGHCLDVDWVEIVVDAGLEFEAFEE